VLAKSLLGVCGFLLLTGCGSSSSEDTTGTGGGGTSGSGGSATGGSGGSATGGSGGSSIGETVTIETAPRRVEIGEEAFFCQNISNPFGQDVEVLESQSSMSAGSHHMFVFYEGSNSDGPVVDCSGLEFDRAVHSSQSQEHTITYPPDVGRFVGADDGFRVMAHYLNTTGAPVDAVVKVTFRYVPSGTVQHQAAAVFFNNMAVYVGAKSSGQAEKTCDIPYDIQLIDAVSHMHQYGETFQAKTQDGTVIYETDTWDEPETAKFDPPLALPAGTQITWTCNYDNPTNLVLTFGESAQTNEMCIFGGVYFPAPEGESIVCF
jgi:hypothetical protein